MGFGSPTSLMQHAVCDLLDYRPSMEALARKQALVGGALTAIRLRGLRCRRDVLRVRQVPDRR